MQERGTRLKDKVAIVTGAGATGGGDFVGIGQAISILFAREGPRVLLVDRDQENAETTLATINEEGGEASVFVGDVTSNTDCQGMACRGAIGLAKRAGQQRRDRRPRICHRRGVGRLGQQEDLNNWSTTP